MAAQHPEWCCPGQIPDGHQRISACTGEQCAIWTPCQVIEAALVTLHETHALPTCHIPHPQRAIFAATEQAVAVGRESQTIPNGAMPLEHRSRAASLHVPQPDRGIKACA